MSNGEPESAIRGIAFERLKLDPENPRLLRLRAERGDLSETEMAAALLEGWDPEPIGRSLVEFGFFPSEPLIVFADGDDYIVAEGNRRLLALKLLLDPALREAVDASSRWSELAEEMDQIGRREDFETIPCHEVPDRAAAAPTIGYRHVVGIEKWDAYEKAAFVAYLLRQDETRTIDDVSDLTGEKPRRVQRYLRDFYALEQAERDGLDVDRATHSFGRFERAMNTRGVKDYIEAVEAAEVTPESADGYAGDSEQMGRLLSFLYGEPGGPDPLFTDTRRIDHLATALSSEDGRTILEQDRDLDRAFDAAGGRKQLVLKSLEKAMVALQVAAEDFTDFADDPDVVDALAAVAEALEALREGTLEPRPEAEEEYDLDADDEDEADEIDDGGDL